MVRLFESVFFNVLDVLMLAKDVRERFVLAKTLYVCEKLSSTCSSKSAVVLVKVCWLISMR